MAFTEDLTVFFADFGDDATLDGVAVQVIGDMPGGPVNGLAAVEPQVQIATDSVPAAYQDLPLVISTGRMAGSWTVREHLPDGTGISLLLLQRA